MTNYHIHDSPDLRGLAVQTLRASDHVVVASATVDLTGISVLRVLAPIGGSFSALAIYRPLLSELTGWAASIPKNTASQFAQAVKNSGAYQKEPPELPFPAESSGLIEVFVPTPYLDSVRQHFLAQLEAFGNLAVVRDAWEPGRLGPSEQVVKVVNELTVAYSPATVHSLANALRNKKARRQFEDPRIRRFLGQNMRLFPFEVMWGGATQLSSDYVFGAWIVRELGWPEFYRNVLDVLEIKNPVTQAPIVIEGICRDTRFVNGSACYRRELQAYLTSVEHNWPIVTGTLGM